ncbi:hypothetical protein H2203_000901 [Taxawa tesnikishii (nom. ined.)]|nr:hypothetical protein H2203_000901 [Dothideales sp. JES 119]
MEKRFLLVATLFLLFRTARSAGDPTTNPGNPDQNAEDLYGVGMRAGIYMQTAAFLIGFSNLIRLEAKSQFAGVILATQMLVRWFARKHERSISTAELWVGLALILIFTTPGAWLLTLTYSCQRNAYRDKRLGQQVARKSVVEGQGLNILQVVVIFVWTVLANSLFAYKIVAIDHGGSYPPLPGQTNAIWVLGGRDAHSSGIKVFMYVEAVGTTVLTFVPVAMYAAAWIDSLHEYWRPSVGPAAQRKGFEDLFGGSILFDWLNLRTKWVYLLFGCFFCSYSAFLALSVEMTIRSANMHPEHDIQNPGQLLPMITGTFSLLSALADLIRRPVPTENRAGPSSYPSYPPPDYVEFPGGQRDHGRYDLESQPFVRGRRD